VASSALSLASSAPDADPLLTMSASEVSAVRNHLLKLRTPPPPPPPPPPSPPSPPHPPNPPPSPPPFAAFDLEFLPEGWSAAMPGADFGWTRQAGVTPSRGMQQAVPLTGPAHDHSGRWSGEAGEAGRAAGGGRGGKAGRGLPSHVVPSTGGHYYYMESSDRCADVFVSEDIKSTGRSLPKFQAPALFELLS
jgi:hypothetical protein